MKRVKKNCSNRENYFLEKQSSVESNSSDETEYGPDTEFIHTCKRMFSMGEPIASTIDRYPGKLIRYIESGIYRGAISSFRQI